MIPGKLGPFPEPATRFCVFVHNTSTINNNIKKRTTISSAHCTDVKLGIYSGLSQLYR